MEELLNAADQGGDLADVESVGDGGEKEGTGVFGICVHILV